MQRSHRTAPRNRPRSRLWNRGTRGPEFEGSKLASHPPKLTVTPASEIPLDRLKVPPGFRVELWALGMRFYTGSMYPAEYRDAIFVARRGSWNRTQKTGFDVVVVRAGVDGKGAKMTPFLTGFLDEAKNEFWGRPVDVLQMPDGSMLVSDEQFGAIYRVSYTGTKR